MHRHRRAGTLAAIIISNRGDSQVGQQRHRLAPGDL
jgi:hypothetical protein